MEEVKIDSFGNYILDTKSFYKVIVKQDMLNNYKKDDCFFILCLGPHEEYNKMFKNRTYYRLMHSRFGFTSTGGGNSLVDSKYFQYFQLI